MKIEEIYYGVLLPNLEDPAKTFIAFNEDAGPKLFRKRADAVRFKNALVSHRLKLAKVVKIAATFEIGTGKALAE